MEKSSKSIIVKLLVALLIIVVGLGALFLAKALIKGNNNPNGEAINVNIVIIDSDDTLLHDDHFKTKEETLLELLEANYEIRYEHELAGTFLYDLAELKTDKFNSYIAIYVDDEYSNFGVDGIKLYDGIKITFKKTVLS